MFRAEQGDRLYPIFNCLRQPAGHERHNIRPERVADQKDLFFVPRGEIMRDDFLKITTGFVGPACGIEMSVEMGLDVMSFFECRHHELFS